MIQLFLSLAITVLTSSAWADKCLQTTGEAEPCANEQMRADSVLATNKPFLQMKYCGVNPPHAEACRMIVRYKDSKGVLSEEVFEEWFISNPGLSKETQYRSLMLKSPNGQYTTYWDNEFIGKVEDPFVVDEADPKQKNVDVKFNGMFPVYDFHYLTLSGKPPVRAIFQYGVNQLSIQKYNPEAEGLGEKLVYTLESMRTIKSSL